jgi:hypothetical protein
LATPCAKTQARAVNKREISGVVAVVVVVFARYECLLWPPTTAHYTRSAGAVLKKVYIFWLWGLSSPGPKIHVLKEHSFPAPVLVLKGEGRIYNIFGARAF